MDKQTVITRPVITCAMRHCSREIAAKGLCAICADAVGADRAGTAISYRADGTAVLRSDVAADRAALRRAVSKRTRDLQQQAQADAAKLVGVRNKYGEDATHDAIEAALLRRDREGAIDAGRSDARGKLSNVRTTARRRAGIEMKYADGWTPSDPTGETAARRADGTATSSLLLAADTFTRPAPGRTGTAVYWTEMAAALHADADRVRELTIGELAATGLRGVTDSGRPGTIKTRERKTKIHTSMLLELEGLALADRAPMVRPATMVAVNRPARVLAPVVGTGRIK
jgi:hypothetical protein